MKKYLFIAAAFVTLSAFTVLNSIWKNDAAHSQLGFTVTHLGINDISGTFNDFEVSIDAQKADFSDAKFTLTGKTGSINTHIEARDNHLKSADFFDAEQYPDFKFVSTSVKPNGKNKLKVTGDLTLHGVTKSVTLDAIYKGTVENPMSKKQTAGFHVSGVIKRSDFHVGDKFPSTMVSDEVRINANGEFVQ